MGWVSRLGAVYTVPFGALLFFVYHDSNMRKVFEGHAYDVCACFLRVVPQVDSISLVDFFYQLPTESPVISGFLF